VVVEDNDEARSITAKFGHALDDIITQIPGPIIFKRYFWNIFVNAAFIENRIEDKI